ncbi:MAG TPA: GDSL-type esterase/lipase family protein [Planctomycetota bacterium]|jgi:lysophospholipase L1-like esterase|nr:GDSL-type esterase/lipase family protein [Planctomycetota bacterium]
MERRAKLVRSGAAFLLGAVAASGLLEVLVRLLWKAPPLGYPPGMFVADEAAGVRLARNFRARHKTPDYDIEIRTNARGFRGPELGRKPEGGRRILALGDSFGFGHGVEAEEAYPAVLERVLRDRGEKVEVVNAGVPGYGTSNEFGLLAAEAPSLDPDVVVLGFYVGNDFRNNHAERFGRLTARSGVLVTRTARDAGWRLTLKAAVAVHWRTAQFLLLGRSQTSAGEQETLRRTCAALPWDEGFGTAMTCRSWDADAARAFELTVEWLRRVAELCAAQRRGLLIVLLPTPLQYDPALWSIALQTCGLNADDYDLAKPDRELLRWGAEQGVAVLDLLPALRARTTGGSGVRLYVDVHLNSEGHRLVAEEIAGHMAEASVPRAPR